MSKIIDIILASGGNKRNMSASDFLMEVNPHGYCSRNGLIDYFKDTGEQNLNKFEIALEYIKKGYDINSLPIVQTDDNRQEYMWLRFELPKSEQLIRLIVIERMANFIKDYQQGKIKPDFTLEELYSATTQEDAA